MKYQLKQHEMKIIFSLMGLIWCLLLFANVATSTTEYAEMSSDLNPNPPNNPVRLIFIHHSTGENWLYNENGGLGIALRDKNYYVSDTNYGWGPTYTDGSSTIGDHTDIGHWWEWFRGTNSSTYLSALYNEGDQDCSYSRLSSAPPGENEVIMFKSCFPNSALQGNPNDPVPSIGSNPLRGEGSGSEYHTVANAKGIYIDLLEYFRTRQDKLFIVITAPPLMANDTNAAEAANARTFNDWLVTEWLAGYPNKNVAVFDFYTVLTSNGGNADTNDVGWETGNHHRWWNGAIQHIQTVNNNTVAYPTGDSHPSQAGNLKATGEFVKLLNIAYHRWKDEPPTGIRQWANISGRAASPPALARNPAANKLFLVVRAFDNSIWVATFDADGNFNNDWVSIPGQTISPPALAWHPGAQKLLLVARAFDNSIWTSSFSSTGTFNNDWASIPGRTVSPPALGWNAVSNKLQMVVRAADNSIWTSSFSSTGVFNNDWASIPGRTVEPPALAWNSGANKLQMVVRAADNSIWTSSFSSTGVFNNDWASIPGMTVEPPALAWDGAASELGMVVRAADDSIWFATFNSTGTFSNDWVNIPGRTASPPGMAYLPSAGYLAIVVRASDNSLWEMLY